MQGEPESKIERRCRGHCCKRFAMEHSFEELQGDYAIWRENPASSKIPDVEKIATMVVPLRSSRDGREHVYTCKHLQKSGDCGIYESRPQMCRDFPEQASCHFWACRSSQSAYFGLPLWKRLLKRWRWVRGLAQR
ncbi:MAG: YkgJ family cysteine cluster protein [Bdellovibrionota bacterium]